MRLLARFAPFVLALALIAACQGPPPTQYFIITSTPDGTSTPAPTTTPIVIIVTTTPPPGATIAATNNIESPVTAEVNVTEETVAGAPTPTFSRIQVAEQPFEGGRMFWLEPIDQIWVMIENEDDRRSGVWMVFDDEFEEGDVEIDPALTPPSEELLQPERGFGKLWRENPDLQEALGWARQPEIGHVSNYQYQPSGEIVDGNFIPGSGYHILTSGFNNRTYRFNEINGTWQTLERNQE
jgi:hypothetical protein